MKTFRYSAIQNLDNAFVDVIDNVLKDIPLKGKNIDKNEYMKLIKKFDCDNVPNAPVSAGLLRCLDNEELAFLRSVRQRLLENSHISENSVFQKTLSFFDEDGLENYIKQMNSTEPYPKGASMTVGGSIILAADAKQFKTPKEMFDGLGLNYWWGKESGGIEGVSPFATKQEGPYYVIRYKTENYDAAKVPVAVDPTKDAYLSQYADSYMTASNQNPFTGTGHVPGAPELMAKGGSQKVSEGIIVRIDSDGTETVVAVTDKMTKKLVKIN